MHHESRDRKYTGFSNTSTVHTYANNKGTCLRSKNDRLQNSGVHKVLSTMYNVMITGADKIAS